MCTKSTVKLFGSFPQHQHGAAQELKATTKMQGKPPRAPVWGLPAQKVPSDSCSGKSSPSKCCSHGPPHLTQAQPSCPAAAAAPLPAGDQNQVFASPDPARSQPAFPSSLPRPQ